MADEMEGSRMRWVWAAGGCLLLAGCGGLMVRPPYRPADGNAVQSPYDVASPGDEIFTRESDAFPLATVSLPAKAGEPAKVETVLDILKPAAPATGPAIHRAPETQPVPTQIIGGAAATTTTPPGAGTALPAKVVGQDKQVGDVVAATDASGNLELFVTSATGVGSVTLEKTGENWPGAVNVHLSYGASRPFTEVSGMTASELLPSGGALPLRTSAHGSDVTVSVPRFTRSARIRIEWIDKYR